MQLKNLCFCLNMFITKRNKKLLFKSTSIAFFVTGQYLPCFKLQADFSLVDLNNIIVQSVIMLYQFLVEELP